MKREIKFRAWTKGGMLHDIGFFMKSLGEVNGRNIEVPENLNEGIKHIQEKGAILMQFTGLKDKNGKEIYEGDIIRIGGEGGAIFEVSFSECQWKLISSEKVASLRDEPRWNEIIGNIYENPKLLK